MRVGLDKFNLNEVTAACSQYRKSLAGSQELIKPKDNMTADILQ
jgi:hypothetical protein